MMSKIMNSVILNKKVSIERCIQQIDTYYKLDTGLPFAKDYLRQDAISMNLQRACELAIDIANHLIKIRKLGLPADSRDSFALLEDANLISQSMSRAMQDMVGFRNILVHDYRRLNLEILEDVATQRKQDLLDFATIAVTLGIDAD